MFSLAALSRALPRLAPRAPLRAYATEAPNLSNLAPAPGSSHKVRSPHRARAALTHTARENESVEESVPGAVGRLDVVTRDRELARATGSPRCTLQEARRPSLRPSQKEDLTIRAPSLRCAAKCADGVDDRLRQEMTPLNLDRLQHWIDRGLIDPTQPITMKELFATRCVHGIKDGVKLLADVRDAHPRSSELTAAYDRAEQSSRRQGCTSRSRGRRGQQSGRLSRCRGLSSLATRTVSHSCVSHSSRSRLTSRSVHL